HDCEATKIQSSYLSGSDSRISFQTKFKTLLSVITQPFQWLGIGGKLESGIDAEASFVEANSTIWEKTGITVEDIVDRFSYVIKILEKRGVFTSEITKSRTLTLKLFRREIKLIWFIPQKVKQHRKLVFILDELDFYDGDSNTSIKPSDVLGVIKKFKNLFTLSSAHFIFIVGKQTYLAAKIDPYRTLFSDRCFLSIPDGQKLSKYLDEIAIGSIKKDLKPEWEEMKWLLIAQSKHNLYDLVTTANACSVYDEDAKKMRLELFERTPSEKVIVAFHYLLNDIFIYYRQSSIFEHHNDSLFEELYRVELAFKKYLFEKAQDTISFVVEDTGSIEVNSALRDAKLALVRTLYLFANKKAPPIEAETSIALPWDEFRQALMLEKVKQGIRGAVTSGEQTLVSSLDILIGTINQKYANYLGFEATKANIKYTLEVISKLLGISFNASDIDALEKAWFQVNTLPVDQRNWDLITQSVQSATAISTVLSKYDQVGKHIVVFTDWGQAKIENNLITLGNDSTHGNKHFTRVTFLLPKIEKDKSLELRAKVTLSEGAILNFLFYKDYQVTELESDFYMARLDSRNNKVGDCILYKPKGGNWDIVPDSTVKQSGTSFDKEVEVKIILNNKGLLELRKRMGRIYQVISRVQVGNDMKLLGFGNELAVAMVEIQSLQIGKRLSII
ncbi:hypothetical protein HZB58_05285, partial [Candidatus Gottesmanbacteria bacterium]|nr:hypothetical protein [Candidatus Gottesmanbacteria bacterium]